MEDKEDVLIIKPSKDDIISLRALFFVSFFMGIWLFFRDSIDNKDYHLYCFILALILFRTMITSNYTKILSSNGIIVEKGNNRKYYSWKELSMKRVNCYKGYLQFEKAVVLSRYKYIQGQGISPGIYEFINPNLLIAIPVAKKEVKPEEDGSFCGCVDENTIAEKLREWHVELEGDELGKPPWKEFL